MGATDRFQYVQEWTDEFLSLFSHRYDYIYAQHPEPGESPNWRTESRHPLSDRILSQGAYLFGVRFGTDTQYCLLDIDIGSAYHPRQDPLALSLIQNALEPLGLVKSLTCTSSYSGGLHLYFPFQLAQNTWQLEIAISTLIENSGFKLLPGQLEVFPNPRTYVVDGKPMLFNGHRLPLQAGSYLLNPDLQPIWSSQEYFVQQWRTCQQYNDLDTSKLQQILKQARRRPHCISGKADKFINDLNAEIEPGWTGPGQTNRLLGRIAMHGYIFHHILHGGAPLEGEALVNEIVCTAQSLPGYSEWCQHQHEIEQRAEEWGRCIENSHYFHYGEQHGKFKSKTGKPNSAPDSSEQLTWNQQRSEATREKIRRAIAELSETGQLPSTATARFRILTGYGIGGGSLYRHRDLWHPEHLWKFPPDPPTSSEGGQLDCIEDASNWHTPSSLLSSTDSNTPNNKYSSHSDSPNSDLIDGNSPPDANSPGSEAKSFSSIPHNLSPADTPVGVEYVQHALWDIQTHLEDYKQAAKAANAEVLQSRQEAIWESHLEQMRRFLSSGDPILMAEAQAWAEQHPELFNREETTLNRVEVLSQIAARLKQLAWPTAQVRDSLLTLFGESSITELDDPTLAQWLRWLANQSEPPNSS